jgi:hypothetical protein
MVRNPSAVALSFRLSDKLSNQAPYLTCASTRPATYSFRRHAPPRLLAGRHARITWVPAIRVREIGPGARPARLSSPD